MNIIMYHYVRNYSSEFPHFRFLDINDFSAQLDFFESKYGFLSREEYIESIKTSKPKNGVVLTFDDGLKDHYNFVYPELKRRGLWGIFYIPTGQYKNKKILDVHRIHLLKGKLGSTKVLKKVLDKFEETEINSSLIKEFSNSTYHYYKRDEDEIRLQRILNYYIDNEIKEKILDQLMLEFFNENKILENIYLSKKEIKEISNAGNIIGPHTVNHSVLSKLSYDNQMNEINESLNFLQSFIDIDYKSFCYPYGYKSSFNDSTIKILKSLNFDDACIFDNKFSNKKIEKYQLSRIDCNQFLNNLKS